MKKTGSKNYTRREFVKAAGAVTLSAAIGGPMVIPRRASAQKKTISLLHWSHFVPPFNPELQRQVEEWGKLRGLEARVDFIAIRDLAAKLAAEAESRRGHDVVEVRFFAGPLYRANLVPLGDVARDLEKTAGPWLDIAKYVGFVGGEWVSLHWYYYNIPANINTDHWSKIGMSSEDVAKLTWDGLLEAAPKLQANKTPVGMAISECSDGNDNTFTVLWSFGASMADAQGNVTINSPQTAAAVEYVKKLAKFMPEDIMAWDDSSNNRFMLSGAGSWSPNGPSVWAVAKKDNMPIQAKIDHVPMPAGPAGRFRNALPICLGVWKFSPNINLAKDLVRYLLKKENFEKQAEASWGYNLPLLVGNRTAKVWTREKALRYYEPPKEPVYVSGYPAPPSPATQIALNLYIIPTMFAKAVSGETSTAKAIEWAEKQLKRIYAG
jgi:multiple sugar transport system substrate-binding protein